MFAPRLLFDESELAGDILIFAQPGTALCTVLADSPDSAVISLDLSRPSRMASIRKIFCSTSLGVLRFMGYVRYVDAMVSRASSSQRRGHPADPHTSADGLDCLYQLRAGFLRVTIQHARIVEIEQPVFDARKTGALATLDDNDILRLVGMTTGISAPPMGSVIVNPNNNATTKNAVTTAGVVLMCSATRAPSTSAATSSSRFRIC